MNSDTSSVDQQDDNLVRLQRWIQCWTSLVATALVAITWRLWFPQFSESSFPIIPLVDLSLPLALDSLFSGVFLIGLLVGAFAHRREGFGLALVAGIVLFLLNQHRLQPWAYQFCLISLIALGLGPRWQLRWLQWLTTSIYLFSSISKFDYTFLHGVGPQLLDNMLKPIGVELETEALVSWSIAIPIAELLFSIALLVPVSKRVGGCLACLFHVTLIALLGPWAMGHSWAVILWNGYFAGLSALLFVIPGHIRPAGQQTGGGHRTKGFLVAAFVLAAMFLPTLERAGWWDHWLSWALYAPHSSRVEIEIAETVTDRLPPDVIPLLRESEGQAVWVSVPLQQWSLDSLGVPVYPQDRFQAGVAVFLAQRLDSEYEVRAHFLSSAGRTTGERERSTHVGLTEIQRAAQAFWWNTLPRRIDSDKSGTPTSSVPTS